MTISLSSDLGVRGVWKVWHSQQLPYTEVISAVLLNPPSKVDVSCIGMLCPIPENDHLSTTHAISWLGSSVEGELGQVDILCKQHSPEVGKFSAKIIIPLQMISQSLILHLTVRKEANRIKPGRDNAEHKPLSDGDILPLVQVLSCDEVVDTLGYVLLGGNIQDDRHHPRQSSTSQQGYSCLCPHPWPQTWYREKTYPRSVRQFQPSDLAYHLVSSSSIAIIHIAVLQLGQQFRAYGLGLSTCLQLQLVNLHSLTTRP